MNVVARPCGSSLACASVRMSHERIASVVMDAALASNAMAEERLTFLNLRAVSRSHLFEAARSLIGDAEPRGPALVVAQAAVEVGVETAIDFALQLRDVQDPLREWVGTALTSWSPTNERVQGLWTALTGDSISDFPRIRRSGLGDVLSPGPVVGYYRYPVVEEKSTGWASVREWVRSSY